MNTRIVLFIWIYYIGSQLNTLIIQRSKSKNCEEYRHEEPSTGTLRIQNSKRRVFVCLELKDMKRHLHAQKRVKDFQLVCGSNASSPIWMFLSTQVISPKGCIHLPSFQPFTYCLQPLGAMNGLPGMLAERRSQSWVPNAYLSLFSFS